MLKDICARKYLNTNIYLILKNINKQFAKLQQNITLNMLNIKIKKNCFNVVY